MQSSSVQHALPIEGNHNEDGVGMGNESEAENFCKCKGEYQSLTGYFVMCESEDDCINGGWLHPECTRDLFRMTQEEIMKLDKWYCEDCTDRRNDVVKQPRLSQNSEVKQSSGIGNSNSNNKIQNSG